MTARFKFSLIAVIGLAAAASVGAGSASAQNVRRSYSAGAQAVGNGGGQLPFSSNYRRPAVSAYNQISNFSNNPQAASNLYQSLVVPQQQQEQQKLELMGQSRDMKRLQNQVQSIQRDTRGRQFDETIRPTGHRATYMNYSHFYGGQ